jgi:hypothetical protein
MYHRSKHEIDRELQSMKRLAQLPGNTDVLLEYCTTHSTIQLASCGCCIVVAVVVVVGGGGGASVIAAAAAAISLSCVVLTWNEKPILSVGDIIYGFCNMYRAHLQSSIQ